MRFFPVTDDCVLATRSYELRSTNVVLGYCLIIDKIPNLKHFQGINIK